MKGSQRDDYHDFYSCPCLFFSEISSQSPIENFKSSRTGFYLDLTLDLI